MEDIAQVALKELLKKASYAEVRVEDTTSHQFAMKNSVVQSLDLSRVQGIGARFIVDGVMGFASTNDLASSNVRQVMRDAILGSASGRKIAEQVTLSSEMAHKDSYEVKMKEHVLDMPVEDKIRLIQEMDKALPKDSVPARYLHMSDQLTTEHLITSEGTKITSTVPRVAFWYFLTMKHGADTAQRYWQYGASGGYEFVRKWNLPEVLAEDARSTLNTMKNGVKAPTGDIDLVVGPQVTGIMVHESCGHPMEADRIFGREAAQAGESFVKPEMVGQRIGSEPVTIVDDPTVENSFGFYKYDNEGVKARRKLLYDKGVIREFLHNRETAARMGLPSNGSSRATDYDKESIVRMSNTFLLPGEFSEEELIRDVKRGVFIRNFMEWNIDDRRLNAKYVGAEAYLIEKGELTKPVRNPTIEVTTPKLWSSVDGVARNLEMHAGSCGKGEPMQGIPAYLGGPSMRIAKMRLSN